MTTPNVHIPDKLLAAVNRKTLTDTDRAAARHIAGDDKHLYQPAR